MATSTPTPPNANALTPAEERARMIHAIALGAAIACPIIALLPPRKMDIYTYALMAGTALGANQLVHERTGTSLVNRIPSLFSNPLRAELPPKAMVIQERLRAEREGLEERAGRERGEEGRPRRGVLGEMAAKEKEREKEREGEGEVQGALEKLWMGGEKPDWKERRDQREKEAIAQGKGYGDLIMEQIWDVWSWGREKTEEIKEKDEEVVAARKEGEK